MRELARGMGWSRWRLLAVSITSLLLVAALWSPAGAHDGSTTHLWNTHIKPMGDAGTINTNNNPVHWTKLKGVPSGFADGIDHNAPIVGLGLQYGDFGILTIDPSETQRRVDGTCPTGQAIRSVSSSGTVNCSTGPQAHAATVGDSGIICNGGCNEAVLALPAGRWFITGKLRLYDETFDDVVYAVCELRAGGQADAAQFSSDDVAIIGMNMQLLVTLSSPGNAALWCKDDDLADMHGTDVSIIAIRVSG